MKSALKRIYNNSKEFILFALLLLASLSLLSINSNEKIQSVKALAFGSFAFINSFLSGFVSSSTIHNQLVYQRELNARLMLENSLLRAAAIENRKLRKQIGFKDSVDFHLVAGRVISKFGSVYKGQFIIDLGREDSIKEGMPVISENGLVGIVSLCSGKFSVVNHLYNSDLRIAVTIKETGIEGILYWSAGDLIIKNIPTTSSIVEGQEVSTSDFSTIFPPDIPVGHVIKIRETVAGLLSEVEITPDEKIEQVSNIFVLKILAENELTRIKSGN
jgi:rod shape-determining protein MreC